MISKVGVVGCSGYWTNEIAGLSAALQLNLKDEFVLHNAHAEWLGFPADCKDETSSNLFLGW